jgi:hypothetical protein
MIEDGFIFVMEDREENYNPCKNCPNNDGKSFRVCHCTLGTELIY